MSYYGGKWRAAKRYPAPLHRTIVEPFAGGAGYSLRHYQHSVLLVERDERIAGVWRFLIRSRPEDVLGLPLLRFGQAVEELPPCDPDGLNLIRTWVQAAPGSGARRRFSTRALACFAENPMDPQYWGPACRARIASQVGAIKHWRLVEGDYTQAPNLKATWFIDPPYDNQAGRAYKYHELDYASLGTRCRARNGQTIVCENMGATWLPFRPLYQTSRAINGAKATKRAMEAIWP